MTVPITKTIPGSLGMLSGGRGRRTEDEIDWVKSVWGTGLNDAATVCCPWESGGRAGKESGVLFIPGFLPQGDGRAKRKADTSRSWGCHLFRFQTRSIPCLTQDQLAALCSVPGPHLENFLETGVSLDSFMCRGIGCMASFRNYVDILNYAFVSQCQKNGISGPGKLGSNFLTSLWKQCFALNSERVCSSKSKNTDLPTPRAPGLRGDIPLDGHLLGVPFCLWWMWEGEARKNAVCNTIVKPFPMFPSS